jgi:hypothetical protein
MSSTFRGCHRSSGPRRDAKSWGTHSSTASAIGRNWRHWFVRLASRLNLGGTFYSALACASRRGFPCLLLKARPAQYRPSLCRLEGNRCRGAAFRARGTRFRTHASTPAGALRFALLAALGVVGKLFVVKEKLLTCGEHKFCAAIDTGQDSIGKLHGRLPQRRELRRVRP